MEKNYDALKLENQLCFPLYACSKEIIRAYKPFLDPLDLTYTQYIAMMVLWQYKEMTVKDLGKILLLDSGTLTPLLKKLESKNYIIRHREENDERKVLVSLTETGEQLKVKAVEVPGQIGSCLNLTEDEAKFLYSILYKIIGQIE